ncbi:MAG: hypothetical protein WBQ42_00040 [Candidatus Rickettsiella isopodorum]
MQLITDSAGYMVQQMQPKPVSDDYHQSQKASGGAGKITQTTIDQQWDAHLINDAEFTATTSLPSVTFDVNNSYVAEQLGQRVGEEVSHFYHPTPAPRNPNGFWRGVDDVLKMSEGSRKVADFIFTGHYEAPRDSWEIAGFMLGAPIALSSLAEVGVERLGAEAIDTLYQGSQQLGKGLMQASRLMNRWGVFSRNTTLDSTELSLPSFPKHPLEGWTAEQVVQHANQLGLKTERDQLLLWSGLGKNGVELSQEYALAHGGTTLEMTPGGKWLNEMDLFGAGSSFSFAEARKIWESVSMSTMRLASGQVRSFIGQVNPSSIYSQEIQELLQNEKVLGLEPLYIKPRYIFGK